MTPSLIPVTSETSDRMARLATESGMSADTLVSLALDAYELAIQLTPSTFVLSAFKDNYDACRHGAHYCEIA